jgi:siroheme synthase
VYLVGAGPGDPGLLTVRGAELLAPRRRRRPRPALGRGAARPGPARRRADRRGQGPRRHALGAPGGHQRPAGRARAGPAQTVVRLKGGDPFVFARGGEEADGAGRGRRGLRDRARASPRPSPCPPTPASPSRSGSPPPAFTVVTGHEDPSIGEDGSVDWDAVARVGGTIVVLMGVGRIQRIAEELIAGGRRRTRRPPPCIWGTRPEQRTVRATLGTIADHPLESPSVIVVGEVAGLDLAWFERRPLFGRTVVVTRARAAGVVARRPPARAGRRQVSRCPPSRSPIPADGGAALRAAVAGCAPTTGWSSPRPTAPAGCSPRAATPVPSGREGGRHRAGHRRGAGDEGNVEADLVPERFVAEGCSRPSPTRRPAAAASCSPGPRRRATCCPRDPARAGLGGRRRRGLPHRARGPSPRSSAGGGRRRRRHLHVVVHRAQLPRWPRSAGTVPPVVACIGPSRPTPPASRPRRRRGRRPHDRRPASSPRSSPPPPPVSDEPHRRRSRTSTILDTRPSTARRASWSCRPRRSSATADPRTGPRSLRGSGRRGPRPGGDPRGPRAHAEQPARTAEPLPLLIGVATSRTTTAAGHPVPIGVASSSPSLDWLTGHLAALGLDHLFPARRRARRGQGARGQACTPTSSCSPPSASAPTRPCVVLEDSAHGVTAANAAGMRRGGRAGRHHPPPRPSPRRPPRCRLGAGRADASSASGLVERSPGRPARGLPPATPPPAPPHPALRRLVAETRLASTTWSPRCSCARASTSPSRSLAARRGAAHPRLAAQGGRRARRPRHPGRDPLRRPRHKDAEGSGAWDPDGIVQVALRDLRDEVGDDLVLMADLCLDEYTDHGHCGVVDADGEVDNDATLELYAEAAVAQADAGADVVAPSGMMDGQVAAIRDALDDDGHSRSRSSPTPPSTPRPSTARSATRSTSPSPTAATARATSRTRATPARRSRRSEARPRRGRRHGHGEAGARLPRRHRRARAEVDVPLAAYHVSASTR